MWYLAYQVFVVRLAMMRMPWLPGPSPRMRGPGNEEVTLEQYIISFEERHGIVCHREYNVRNRREH